MDETKEITIDLKKIFYMMKGKIVYILLATVLLGAVAGCFTHFFIDPVYSATVKMYVYSNPDRVTTSSSISNNEIDASKELIGTYIDILESDTVMNLVIADLNLNTNPDVLRAMVKPTASENSQIFRVTVNSTDPKLAAKVANSIAKVAPEEIVRIVKAGGVEIVDKATAPKKPSSPNIKKNIVIGAVIGLLVSFIGFFVYELFDSTITKASDLEREFDIPVLGTIPRLEGTDPPTNNSNSLNDLVASKPSNKVLENIKNMKGDAKND